VGRALSVQPGVSGSAAVRDVPAPPKLRTGPADRSPRCTAPSASIRARNPLRDIQRLRRHDRPETTLTSFDITGEALERHASHQVAGFLAGWAG
jgi:hypothetical protein